MNTDQQPEDSSTPPPQPVTAPPAQPESTPGSSSGLSKDSLNMGMLCHLLALSGLIIPLGNVLGPLVIWLMKKDSDPYVDEQGKESVNFQISVAIYMFVSLLLMMIVIGFFLIFVVAIGSLVLTIIGAIKASKGEPWRYPLTLRLIK
jgi:uncharacterized protein